MKRTSAGASFNVTRSHQPLLWVAALVFTSALMHIVMEHGPVVHDCTVCAPDPEVSAPSAPTFTALSDTGFYQPEEARMSPTSGRRWHLAIKGVDCGEVDDQTAREISSMLSRMR